VGWPAKWAAVACAVMNAVKCAEHELGIEFGSEASLMAGIDETTLAKIASTDLSNSFGLWDRCSACPEAVHRSGGHAVFPASALLNHSCLPNAYHVHTRRRPDDPDTAFSAVMTCHALHDIPAGAEIFIRYVDPTGGDAERTSTFKDTWGFTCVCARCHGSEMERTAAAEAWDGAFLCACGYARPGAGPGIGAKPRRKGDCDCPQPWVITRLGNA